MNCARVGNDNQLNRTTNFESDSRRSTVEAARTFATAVKVTTHLKLDLFAAREQEKQYKGHIKRSSLELLLPKRPRSPKQAVQKSIYLGLCAWALTGLYYLWQIGGSNSSDTFSPEDDHELQQG